VKVKILEKPKEAEIDGVRLDSYQRGEIREVSSSVGAWLIANRYADPEMRRSSENDDGTFSGVKDARDQSNDHPRRRSSDY
jgi:nicotinic acid phosphoribosyltransferase